MKCPRCGECPFPKGVCERVVSRGRRYFLMGALALPVAAQIERLAPLVAPAPEYLYSVEAVLAFRACLEAEWNSVLTAAYPPWYMAVAT